MLEDGSWTKAGCVLQQTVAVSCAIGDGSYMGVLRRGGGGG